VLNQTAVEIAALLRRCVRLRMKAKRMCSQAARMAERIEKEKQRLTSPKVIEGGGASRRSK
jgi:hypothetical protein